jgi:DNA-binding response OmpR family regulator
MTKRLLLVEDDPNLGQILQEYLQAKGYATTLVTNGQQAWETYQQTAFDLCLLDVMLPKMDGFTLAEKIRKNDQQTPIIFLTAKSLKEDTLQGLRIGADDYLTKPFSLEELLLRIQAILRRIQNTEVPENKIDEPITIGQFQLHPQSQELVYSGEEPVSLTAKESQLLYMLGSKIGTVLDRSEALKAIWHDDSYFNARSMDVYITKLRKRLRKDKSLQIISVRGEGYKLVVLPNFT